MSKFIKLTGVVSSGTFIVRRKYVYSVASTQRGTNLYNKKEKVIGTVKETVNEVLILLDDNSSELPN